MDPVQEIKNRLPIEDLVAQYVTLKRAGKYLKANCPFHDEKTPSFFVSPDKQIAYCFSCQKGGDHFQFLQEIENIGFKEALELLADKVGIELPKQSGKKGPSKEIKDRLRQINADADKFFVHNLTETEDGKKVMAYLEQRGMKSETIAHFHVGFAPESKDQLYRHLLELKHEKDDLLQSTIVTSRDAEAKQIYDRFHLRLMFPIDDAQGHVIAFGGRALKKGDQPKYLNSPEYALYNKSATLYNMGRAKQAIRDMGEVIIVEGYFDVMASHQAALPNVVATCGTALTESQFKLIKRYAKKVILAFDSDSAGQDALLRAVHTAQGLDLELYVVAIDGGKDAADLVQEDPKLWSAAVEAKKPYMDHFEQKWRSEYDLSDAKDKRSYTDKMMELIDGITHPVEKDHYLKALAKRVETPIDLLYDVLKQLQSSRRPQGVRSKQQEEEERTAPIRDDKQIRLRRYFLSLLLAFPRDFFETWERFEDVEKFLAEAKKIGIIGPVHKLSEEGAKSFRDSFEKVLEWEGAPIDVSSVYKQVRDQYNLRAELGEAFYANLDQADELKALAFEAEVKNPDPKLVKQEFEKLITLLYLEFTP